MERIDKATLLRKILPVGVEIFCKTQGLVLTFRSWNISLCTDK